MGGFGVVTAMNRLRYSDLASNEKALLAHTGLKQGEFTELCLFFDQAWQRSRQDARRQTASAPEQTAQEQHLAHDWSCPGLVDYLSLV